MVFELKYLLILYSCVPLCAVSPGGLYAASLHVYLLPLSLSSALGLLSSFWVVFCGPMSLLAALSGKFLSGQLLGVWFVVFDNLVLLFTIVCPPDHRPLSSHHLFTDGTAISIY